MILFYTSSTFYVLLFSVWTYDIPIFMAGAQENSSTGPRLLSYLEIAMTFSKIIKNKLVHPFQETMIFSTDINWWLMIQLQTD